MAQVGEAANEQGKVEPFEPNIAKEPDGCMGKRYSHQLPGSSM